MLIRLIVQLVGGLFYWIFRWGVTSTETPQVTHYSAQMNAACPGCGTPLYETVLVCHRCGRNRQSGQPGA